MWVHALPPMKATKTGGSGTSSLSLSPYAGGDLQNNQKHNRQLILIFLSFWSRSVSSLPLGLIFLLLMADLVAVGAAVEMGGSCPVDKVSWRKASNGWFLWRPIYRKKERKKKEVNIRGREGWVVVCRWMRVG